MAQVYTVRPNSWSKHLKPFGRRVFWSRERMAAKEVIRRELAKIDEACITLHGTESRSDSRSN